VVITLSLKKKMPLTKNESKKILLNAFRLALAVSEKRQDDATIAYSNILDSALLTHSDDDSDDDDMPPLIPLCKPESNINLVISEIEQSQQQAQEWAQGSGTRPVPYAFAYASPPYAEADCTSDYEDGVGSDVPGTGAEEAVESVMKKVVVSAEEEEVVAESEEEADEEEADEEEADEEEADEEEAEEEEEEVEELELELELEPVRIKKVIYWKDSKSGDIYVCLPEDEVGDKVGRYVDGKPVFD